MDESQLLSSASNNKLLESSFYLNWNTFDDDGEDVVAFPSLLEKSLYPLLFLLTVTITVVV
jgi:hypothetical protein